MEVESRPTPLAEHTWVSLIIGKDRLWAAGAYLRPLPRLQIIILAVFEGRDAAALRDLVCILPSGERLKVDTVMEIRHMINKGVLITFSLDNREEERLRRADGRVDLSLSLGSAGEDSFTGLLLHRLPLEQAIVSEPVVQEKRVVHCLGTLFGTVNVAMLIEWFEYHLAQGVDHFHVYDSTVPAESRELHNVLMSYVAQGVITYHPWQGIGCDDAHTCPADTKVPYTYHAQDLAIHDCLLREEGAAQWVLFGDLDEVWVVEDGGTSNVTTLLLPPLEALHNAEPGLEAWIFKKVWVMTADQMPQAQGEGLLLPQYRRKHHGAAGGLGGGGRVKYALRVAQGQHKLDLPMQVRHMACFLGRFIWLSMAHHYSSYLNMMFSVRRMTL